MQTAKTFKTAWLLAALSIGGWAATQAQTTATWIGPSSGGEWNTGANWDTAAPPLASTTNALIGRSTNVDYNLPMVAASFGSLTNRGVLNINTNGFNSGSIIMTIPSAIAKLFVNTGGVLNITGDLGFCSNSIVSMAAGSSVTISGTNIIGSGVNGGLAGVTVGAFGSMTNIGGNLTASATALNPGNTSIGTSCRLVIEGGINNLGAYSAQRSPGGANAPPALGSDGLVISNGIVNTTSISVGNNAHGIMYLVGGTVTNTGTFTLVNGTGTRPARFHQVGGLFVQPDPNVVIMSGSADTAYSVLGGTNIVGGYRFTGITVFFTNAGAMYVGSAGISSNGTTTLNVILNNGGLFGATTNWVGSVPMRLNTGGSGQFTFQAADTAGNPTNIQITGVLSGSGNLNKTGGGTLLLSATNINTGSTLVNGGTLALDVNGSTTSTKIIVGSGATFDVSAVTGGFVVSNQSLCGSGVVTGAVSVASGATIDPGSNVLTGALSFSNSVTETGGAINHFDLIGAPNPNNDLVIIAGDLNVSATNNVDIAGASLVTGTNYILVRYGGNFNGGISNFTVTTAIGTLTNNASAKTISFIPQALLRGPTNIVWSGNPVNTNWDTQVTTNWLNAGALDFFVPADSVQFTDAGASNSPVNIVGTVLPTSVLVNSHSNYVFASTSGGWIGGATGLTVTNTGTLTILTTNTYSGVTTIDGGSVLAVSQLANGLAASAIGASDSSAANLVINTGTLSYSGPSNSIDRGATLGTASSAISISANGNLTLGGGLTGNGGLTKAGPGILILAGASSFAGVTTLSNGILEVNGSPALGANNVNFAGGTLSFASAGSQQFYPNNFNVPATATMIFNGANGNNIIGTSSGTGSITGTGASILNISVTNAGGICTINEDIGGFAGTIHLTDDSLGSFRLNSGGSSSGAQQCTGSTNATFDLGNGAATFFNRNGGGASFGRYDMGALAGGSNTKVSGGSTASTYFIGAKNLSTIYSGTIQNGAGAVAITKVGAGKLTLLGQNSYTGPTIVSNGVLALSFNPTNGSDSTINSSATITIAAGAVLDVSGRSDGRLQLNSPQILQGNGTINGILDATGSGIISPGGGIAGSIGTLTVTGNIYFGPGTDWMKLNRDGSPNSDRLVSSTGQFFHFGEDLIVTNIGGPLQAGDTFTLFSGSTSSFNQYNSITLPGYYIWDTSRLAVNGSITVTSVLPRPSVTKADFSGLAGGAVTLSATNGIPSTPVNVLSSTNLALPLGSWTVVTNTTFNSKGNLVDPNSGIAPFTFLVNPAQSPRFYLLQTQ